MKWLSTLLLLLLFPVASFAAPAPTPAEDEAALLLAWEKAQLADPRTKLLEHTAPRSYRFKTERFPYEGSLEVRNIVIQTSPADADYVSGTLEVTLDQPNSTLREQFPTSFPAWSVSNYMMKDVPSNRWVTMSEWSRARRDHRAAQPWWNRPGASALGILLIAGLLLVAAIAAAMRYQLATARRLREDALLRAKLISNAENAASRDERLLIALERQRQLLDVALSGTQRSRRWLPKNRLSQSAQQQPSELAMDFAPSPAQRQRLDLYWALRDLDDPRPVLFSRKLPRRSWIALAVVLIGLLALLLLGAIKAFLLMLGVTLGMTLMNLANREIFAQVWPALRRALDWNKVEALLKNQRNGK